MNDSLVSFPNMQASFPFDTHRLVRGGMNMEIKHTHPEYESAKQREDALKDAKQAAIGAISALKGNVRKHSA